MDFVGVFRRRRRVPTTQITGDGTIAIKVVVVVAFPGKAPRCGRTPRRIRDASVVIHLVGIDTPERGCHRDRVRGIAERRGGVRVDWVGDACGGAETGVDAAGVGEGVGESGDRGGEEVFSVRVGIRRRGWVLARGKERAGVFDWVGAARGVAAEHYFVCVVFHIR